MRPARPASTLLYAGSKFDFLLFPTNHGFMINRAFYGLMTLGTLALAPDLLAGGMLLVANKGDQTLGIVDTVAGRQLAAIPEDGVTGHEVVASPDGRRAF